MQIEFKITVDSTEQIELLPYTNAIERDSFIFDLMHNFRRKWKYEEKDPTLEEVIEEIFALKEKYKVIIE
jgi:hypothetical protein